MIISWFSEATIYPIPIGEDIILSIFFPEIHGRMFVHEVAQKLIPIEQRDGRLGGIIINKNALITGYIHCSSAPLKVPVSPGCHA